MYRLLLVALLLASSGVAEASNCHQFFRRQQVVHRQHHAVNYGHALNQAAYGHHTQPLILYLVGQQKVQDAHIRKIVGDELNKQQPQPQQAPKTATATETLKIPSDRPATPLVPAAAGDLVRSKCGKCHSGDGSVCPEKFDLERGIRFSSFMKFTKFAGREKYADLIPEGMEGVMKKLTPEDLGPIMEFMQDQPVLPEPAENESPETGELR